MPEQREGRRVQIAVLVGAALAALLLLVFFFVPRTAPPVPPRSRGEPTVCRLTRGQETISRLLIGAAPAPSRPGDIIRCTVAPSFREQLEVWAQAGDGEPVQVSAQPVNGPTDLAGLEVPAGVGVMRVYLVRADHAPAAETVREVLREGGKTPRVRVEAYAVEAR